MSNSLDILFTEKNKAHLFDIASKVFELVREKKRNPLWVADILQGIINNDLQVLRNRTDLPAMNKSDIIKEILQENFYSDGFDKWDYFDKTKSISYTKNFSDLVLCGCKNNVPSITFLLHKFNLSIFPHTMTDFSILNEVHFCYPCLSFFNPEEVASVIKGFVSSRKIMNTGMPNILYINLYKDSGKTAFGLIAVTIERVSKNKDEKIWRLDAHNIVENIARHADSSLFFRKY